MESKKINQLATEMSPASSDLTIIGDPITGVSKKVTLEQISSLFASSISFYTNYASFPATGSVDTLYCAKDTNKLYLWSGSAYVETFPSQALLDTYQLRSEKGNANGYASLDGSGKVPSTQLPSYVDDVIEVANYASLPVTGETGKIYITLDNNKIYRWSGSVYVEIASNNAIWGSITGTLSNQTDLQNALNAKVPYTGATANVNLGEYELKTGQLTLDTTPTGTATVGTTRWNDTIGSSETTLKGGNVILKNGVDLVARVVNKVSPNTTLTKAAYPAVRVSGAQGQRLAVAYAQANNDNNSADTIGLVTETIATNQEGFIITVGQLEGINTTGTLQGETWADGDVLYLSPTTAGALTNIKPTGATGHIVIIGYVEYAHANNGKIYVKVMNGWELDELHNVYISSVANNQGLFYESSSDLWKNKSIATVLGYTPISLTSLSATSPLSYNNTTGAFSISQASGSVNGFLSSTDWTTFNNKQNAIGYTPANDALVVKLAGTQTITGDKTFSGIVEFNTYQARFAAGLALNNTTSGGAVSGHTVLGSYADGLQINLEGGAYNYFKFASTSTGRTYTFPNASGTVALTGDLSSYVPTSRTLTINGTTFDLSANRSWTISAGISGSGTTNYVTKFTGGTAIGNSLIFDNGTNVGIGTASPSRLLNISGAGTDGTQVQINGTVDSAGIKLIPTSGDNWEIQANTSNQFFVYNRTDSAYRFLIDGSGNVGIGTTSPTTVTNYIVQTINGTSGSFTEYQQGGSYAFRIGSDSSLGGFLNQTDANPIRFFINNGERMRITSTGNVGIGTTAPNSVLEVYGQTRISASLGSVLLITPDATSTNGVTLDTSYYGTAGYGPMKINVGGSERMRITSGGLLLIGTTSTSGVDKVRINNDGATSYSTVNITNANSTANFYVGVGGGSVANSNLQNNAYVWNAAASSLVFGTSDSARLTISSTGTASFSGGINAGTLYLGSLGTGTVYSSSGTLTNTNPSDKRLKENITPITYGLNEILQLNPVSFDWKNDNNKNKQFGFIAQEVQEVMPEAVIEGEYLGLEKDAIYTALINAIKELEARLKTLENK